MPFGESDPLGLSRLLPQRGQRSVGEQITEAMQARRQQQYQLENLRAQKQQQQQQMQQNALEAAMKYADDGMPLTRIMGALPLTPQQVPLVEHRIDKYKKAEKAKEKAGAAEGINVGTAKRLQSLARGEPGLEGRTLKADPLGRGPQGIREDAERMGQFAGLPSSAISERLVPTSVRSKTQMVTTNKGLQVRDPNDPTGRLGPVIGQPKKTGPLVVNQFAPANEGLEYKNLSIPAAGPNRPALPRVYQVHTPTKDERAKADARDAFVLQMDRYQDTIRELIHTSAARGGVGDTGPLGFLPDMPAAMIGEKFELLSDADVANLNALRGPMTAERVRMDSGTQSRPDEIKRVLTLLPQAAAWRKQNLKPAIKATNEWSQSSAETYVQMFPEEDQAEVRQFLMNRWIMTVPREHAKPGDFIRGANGDVMKKIRPRNGN